jgi:hypothetical protein
MKKTRLAAGLLLTGALLLTSCADRNSSSSSFDQAVWLEGEKAAPSPEAPRLAMADVLVSSRALVGKKRKEVEAMLGPVTDTDKFRDYDLVYWLGATRGFMPIDSEWLVLRLDERDEVSDARVVSD